MREPALFGRARDIQLGDFRVNALERLARLARRALDAIGLLSEVGDRLLRCPNMSTKRLKSLAITIEHLKRCFHEPLQALGISFNISRSGLRRCNARFELSVRFLDARDVARQRAC